jgi:plasmid replication initiation protein
MSRNKKNKTISEEQKNDLIVQHNHLIEARYHLTLQEKRLMCWLASQVKKTDEDFKEHELSIKDFSSLVGIEGDHLYQDLDTITHKLMQKIITIKSLEKKGFTKAALLGGAKYYEGLGIIKLSFHPYLKPYMLQLKERFTQISLGEIIGLRSVHAIRIYELLKQHEPLGKREIFLNDLRDYCGIKTGQYKRFNDFKKDVLAIAKREIDGKTDLSVDYEEIKQSRKVISIRFFIKKNPKSGRTEFEKFQEEKAQIIQKEMRSENALIEEILEYGLSRVTAKKFIKENSEETVRNAIKSVNLQVERGNVKNPKAMLRVAIQERWRPDFYLSRKSKKTTN